MQHPYFNPIRGMLSTHEVCVLYSKPCNPRVCVCAYPKPVCVCVCVCVLSVCLSSFFPSLLHMGSFLLWGPSSYRYEEACMRHVSKKIKKIKNKKICMRHVY